MMSEVVLEDFFGLAGEHALLASLSCLFDDFPFLKTFDTLMECAMMLLSLVGILSLFLLFLLLLWNMSRCVIMLP